MIRIKSQLSEENRYFKIVCVCRFIARKKNMKKCFCI